MICTLERSFPQAACLRAESCWGVSVASGSGLPNELIIIDTVLIGDCWLFILVQRRAPDRACMATPAPTSNAVQHYHVMRQNLTKCQRARSNFQTWIESPNSRKLATMMSRVMVLVAGCVMACNAWPLVLLNDEQGKAKGAVCLDG